MTFPIKLIHEMKNSSIILLILINLLYFTDIDAQSRAINVEGEFIHRKTNSVFPKRIDDYNRSSIIAYDKSKNHLGVGYSNMTSKGKTTFTIFIYPTDGGTEGILRNEFLSSLSSITYINKTGNVINKYVIEYEKDGYKFKGLKARINDNGNKSELLLYQCGLWFLKLRVSSQYLDSSGMADLENKIMELYPPSGFVKQAPLKISANVYFAKSAFVDSLMLGCVMGSAFKKIEWAIENVDSLERISSFPDLYLDLHKAALLAFSKFEKDHPLMSRTSSTIEYLTQLNSIINDGFLNEFIMQQYDMLMIVSPEQQLDFRKFEEWKRNNPIKINLNHYFVLVEYTK